MVCSNCGAELPEGSRFCNNCGTAVIAKNKKEYLRHLAPAKVAKKAKLSKLLAAFCAVLMLVSYLVVINTSLENIPIISLALQDDMDSVTDMKEDMEDFYDQLEKGMEDNEEELEEDFTKGQIRKLKKFLKSVKKCSQKLSLTNFNNMVKRYDAIIKMDVPEEIGDLSEEMEDVRQIKMALGLVSGILFFGAAVSGVLLFCGGFFHKTVLAVLGTLGAFFYCLTGCGFVMLLLVMAAAVFMILQTKAVNSAFKAHKSGQ